MGNWRRVQITGTCGQTDIKSLHDILEMRDGWESFKGFHCLMHTGSICGLPNWANEQINAIGNLAERDYGVKDIAETLRKIAEKCSSLDVKIHIGAEYESDDCIATVSLRDSQVTIGEPEIGKIPELDMFHVQANLQAICRL